MASRRVESFHTHYAPAERTHAGEIVRLSERFQAEPLLCSMLDAIPEIVLILDRRRQIVHANKAAIEFLGASLDQLLGTRPGEAVGCIHAEEETFGCGTANSCRYCGAVNAVLGIEDCAGPSVHECRISRKGPDGFTALDVRISASRLVLGNERLTVFVMRDTTDEKRREVLERLFFHDVLNTAVGLRMLLGAWPGASVSEQAERSTRALRHHLEMLIDEVKAQRDLAAAERGDLTPDPREFDVAPFLEGLCALYGGDGGDGSRIRPPALSGPTGMRSDPVILGRVIGNLIKNALEASYDGQFVTVSYENGGAPAFHVHNENVMSEEVQLQLFQRSFSTKAEYGRGIGTYSVKLLTERYLHGTVEFRSRQGEGTTFTVKLPPER